MLTITEKDVYVYREIYYEHYKRLLEIWDGTSDSPFSDWLLPAIMAYNWTPEKYYQFSTLDLTQRFTNKDNIKPDFKFSFGDKKIDAPTFITLPELKCPRRTTQKD